METGNPIFFDAVYDSQANTLFFREFECVHSFFVLEWQYYILIDGNGLPFLRTHEQHETKEQAVMALDDKHRESLMTKLKINRACNNYIFNAIKDVL